MRGLMSNFSFLTGFTKKNKINKRKTQRKMSKDTSLNCSPAVQGKTAATDTCFTPNILTKIKSEYNHFHRANPIRETEPKKIITELQTRLSKCGKEDCWLSQIKDEKLRDRIKEYVFAPKRPKEWDYNPNEWLSNYDIFNVLTQYEDKYPHFEFIGPSFIDFDSPTSTSNATCVTSELCHFSLKHHLTKKHRKIAIVFNLDKHTGPGTHWVSMFIDIHARFIFYFDSAGSKIPKEIMSLVKRIQKQGLELSRRFKFIENYPMTHQHSNTECGMYSLFFIITMLLENPDVSENQIKRSELTKRRGQKPGSPDIMGNQVKQSGLTKRRGRAGGPGSPAFDRLRFFRKQRIPDKFVENLRSKYFNK